MNSNLKPEMRTIALLLAAFACLLGNTPARAWGQLGHQLVGALAQARLTPQARAQVAELLRNEPDPTLAGVAYWADALRNSEPDRFKATARWHYLNILDGRCHYVATRDCPDGACVVGAIEAQRRLLRDSTQPFEVRRDALKFLVHFVGDVHQPLHAGNRPDKGGNEFQVTLRTDIPPEEYARDRYKDGIMGTNLHSVWDYYVLASAKLPLPAYVDRLASSHVSTHGRVDPARWAEESCKAIDRRRLYPESHEMDVQYLAGMRPVAEQRILVASRRLAQLLNEALASP